MCGRFVLTTPAQALAAHFQASSSENLLALPRYNIAPSQDVVAVRIEHGRRRLVMLRWGLVPAWARDASIGNRMINARAETAAEKPSFRHALAQRRCIVPASGFYEWKPQGRRKQPWYFRAVRHQARSAPDDALLAMAGLWERWIAPDGQALESCAVLVTAANALVAPVHDRMPVLLAPQDYQRWLDPQLEAAAVEPLLVPAPDGALVGYPVTTAVGDPKNDDPGNIEPLEAASEQAAPQVLKLS